MNEYRNASDALSGRKTYLYDEIVGARERGETGSWRSRVVAR